MAMTPKVEDGLVTGPKRKSYEASTIKIKLNAEENFQHSFDEGDEDLGSNNSEEF